MGGRLPALLFEEAPDPLLLLDEGGRILLANRAAQQVFGTGGATVGRPFARLLARHSRRAGRELFEQAKSGDRDIGAESAVSTVGAVRADVYAVLGDGTAAAFQLNLRGARERGGVFVTAALIDIAGRTLAESARQQMAALVESAEDAILVKSLDGIVRTWNPAAQRLLGYTAAEIIGQPVLQLIPDDRKHEELMILESIRQGRRVAHFETVRQTRDGRRVDVSLTISPVRDGSGTIVGASKIMRDITDQKRFMAELQSVNSQLKHQVHARTAELKEREAMLQEIHHRVKNNLQVILSLINLQIRSIDEPAARTALRECQSRVATMAQIHEMLYQSKDYARVPFGSYARKLAASVLRASAMSPESITLAFELDEIHLPVEQAIPCGLILNELVANAVKHAFAPDGAGAITVTLRREAGDRVVLAVGDDGIGTTDEPHRGSPDSLGMSLVRSLTQQIGGVLEHEGAGGTTFRITFPELYQ